MCLAIPAQIVEILSSEENRALIDVAGVRRQIDIGLLEDDPPASGDWVLVHVGFAMSKISEAQALDQLNTLAMLGEEKALMEEIRGYSARDSDAPGGP